MQSCSLQGSWEGEEGRGHRDTAASLVAPRPQLLAGQSRQVFLLCRTPTEQQPLESTPNKLPRVLCQALGVFHPVNLTTEMNCHTQESLTLLALWETAASIPTQGTDFAKLVFLL